MSVPPNNSKRIAPFYPSAVGTQQKWPDPLPPVDGLRLQRTVPVSPDLGPVQIERVVRGCTAELDELYREIGGSGLGCESFSVYKADDGPSAVQITLYPRKADEGLYLEMLAEVLEDRRKANPELETLPFEDHPEDDISPERIEYLRSTQPGDLSDMIAHIESLIGK